MRFSVSLLALGAAFTVASSSLHPSFRRDVAGSTPAQKACNYLSSQFSNATHYPNTTYYNTDNTDFWSAASALGPACIFAPSCAEDLGWAIKVE